MNEKRNDWRYLSYLHIIYVNRFSEGFMTDKQMLESLYRTLQILADNDYPYDQCVMLDVVIEDLGNYIALDNPSTIH